MAHNIEGFKEYYAFIQTKAIKINLMWVKVDNKIKVIAETEKAILVREKIQTDKEMYSIDPFWIPKSRIISIKKEENQVKPKLTGLPEISSYKNFNEALEKIHPDKFKKVN